MRSPLLWFAALVAVLIPLCVLFAQTASPAPFGYDEADYMYAGTRGFAANYLDRGSLSMFGYIEKGLDLLHDKSQRESMSRFIRNSGDLDFYRHYHGPAYAYWIALWHALGARGESVYRASGLVLHALEAVLIFWMFVRVFPHLPAAAAFVAAVTFAMNRTALVAATAITQHVAFAFLACGALFAVAEFLRTGEKRFWYAAAVLMAAAFAAVEIAAVMIGSVVVTVAWANRNWGIKALISLFARGAVCFLAALALLWPPGVFQLNALKGYMYLAYMAVARKTFTPISPLSLWSFKLREYPLEFALLLGAMVVGALWLWRAKSFRAAMPFLFYAIAFFGVTMAITVPYTYYHVSLTMALAVVTGVLFGELWNRVNSAVRLAALGAVLASLAALDVGFYRETEQVHAAKPSGTADAIGYLSTHGAEQALVPYVMVPPLHFYKPELATTGYDESSGEILSQQAAGLPAGTLVFCGLPVCQQVDGAAAATAERVGTLPDGDQAMYAMRLTR